jgi:membrane protein
MPFSLDNIKSADMTDVVMIVIMFLILLTGYRLFKGWCAVAGFVGGLYLGQMLAARFGLSGWVQVLVWLVPALAAAALSWYFYRAGVFAYVFCAAFWLGFRLFDIYWASLIFGAVLGLFAAFIALKLLRPALIVLTSVTGAYVAGGMILDILAVDLWWITLLLFALLALWGMVFQFLTTAAVKQQNAV